MLDHTIGNVGTSNEDFLLLQYPKDTQDMECVWLIGNYCEIVNSVVVGQNKSLKVDQLRGIIRGRMQGMGSRAVIQPTIVNI